MVSVSGIPPSPKVPRERGKPAATACPVGLLRGIRTAPICLRRPSALGVWTLGVWTEMACSP
ncbi:hypothetical protein I79_008407 [Cricetulus griseus]|uniref:Uncharacterized protein n=1 Tax=Cricetulus griseus TaxID=10029 RepID=G3HD33_CRIGR|nr:hypothetical protein I79_008407 [Cricetulus griseus]